MRDLPIFIASSMCEFKQARLELSPFLEMLNSVYRRMDVRLVWNRPETSSRMMAMGGQQHIYDDYIRESEIFALIVERNIGPYTRHEYEIALEQFSTTGQPKILPCFLADTSPEVQAFRMELCDTPIGTQYIDLYDNFDAVKNQLQWELANYIVNSVPRNDMETDMKQARERIVTRIYSLQADITHLKSTSMSRKTIAEITLSYAEIWRLVREYKVEPDALLDYIEFLWRQHQYNTGIEIGHWLKGFYQMEPPGKQKQAMLKNLLGLCYADSHQYEQAEQYYQEELKIEQRLMQKDSAYQSNVAMTYNNLGNLMKDTNRMREAEAHYRKALEIQRRLAEKDSSSLPDVAMTCNNLATLLCIINQMDEAERYYREAFEIWLQFAEDNPYAFAPYVAGLFDNLGVLYATVNQMEKAEECFREALKIYGWLADSNPAAYLPNVAKIRYNLGLFELNRTSKKSGFMDLFHCNQANRDTAKQYFEDALFLYKQFPHCADQAQMCRGKLAMLSELTDLQRKLAKWRRS